MIPINFKRGLDTNIHKIPIEDGNLIVGLDSDNTANMYIDAMIDDKLIRFHLGKFDNSYIERIIELESDITKLKQICGIGIPSALISMNNDDEQSSLITMLDDDNIPVLVEFNHNT